ncbi:MAG TPA: ABC transporter ATP-binding protein [Segeticoccus sp.]|uniref:ABC transporter ATP-binding protein n=1 Tax=Segeticoccus sp. TaxID=2706531 RepID=UPI002D7F370F|nr:ABC transporter ATP-binding protein [Segeticoccus sp.]HET8599546.1 ABC transporter ATP-binding protein [Segeticoccus sp.]
MSTLSDVSTQTGPGRPTGSVPVLRVDDLHVTFASEAGRVRAVRGVSYALQPGQTLGIVGESGSGKSVTSLAVMGLLPPTAAISGSIRLNDRELLGLDDREMSGIRGKEIAMIFQDPLSALTPVFDIETQLAEALTTHQRLGGTGLRKRSLELMDLVGIPNAKARLKSYPHEFSGGMRQRVMIALAIANNPDVIVADEPTTALDVTIQAQILDVLKDAQHETGAAVVMITHDLGVVAGIADQVLVMYAGRPVELGSVEDVYYRPRMPYTMGLLGAVPRADKRESTRLVPIQGTPPSLVDLPPGCPFAPRCPMAIDACRDREPELRAAGDDPATHAAACIRSDEIARQGLTFDQIYDVPETVAGTFDGIPREERQMVLQVEDLERHFPLTAGKFLRRKVGAVRAVDGVSFEVREGETLALVGESGCGKTTTLMEIMQLRAPQGGKVVLMGRDVAELRGRTDKMAIRSQLQIVFQDPMASLDPRMTVYDILAEPLKVQGRRKDEINRRITELMRLVGLNPDHVDRFPRQFSGGQRQRIGIARALAVEPKLVVLDEPVSALDVSIQAGVVNLLEDLQAQLGVSFLFVAHDLSVVRHIADRVAVMYLGQVIELGPTEQVFQTPQHPYTHALLSAVPVPDPEVERHRTRTLLEGDLPSPTSEIVGCRFASRCPKRLTLGEHDRARCDEEQPRLTGEEGADQQRACHFPL